MACAAPGAAKASVAAANAAKIVVRIIMLSFCSPGVKGATAGEVSERGVLTARLDDAR